jgi:hypothetical protein
MADRFDLEQQILSCWQITSDINVLQEQGASAEDMVHLAAVYEFKFAQLWSTFEKMISSKQFVSGMAVNSKGAKNV